MSFRCALYSLSLRYICFLHAPQAARILYTNILNVTLRFIQAMYGIIERSSTIVILKCAMKLLERSEYLRNNAYQFLINEIQVCKSIWLGKWEKADAPTFDKTSETGRRDFLCDKVYLTILKLIFVSPNSKHFSVRI